MRNVRYFSPKKTDVLRLLTKKIATSGWGLYPLVAASVQHVRYLSDLGRAAATPILPQAIAAPTATPACTSASSPPCLSSTCSTSTRSAGFYTRKLALPSRRSSALPCRTAFSRPLRRGPSSPRSAAALPQMSTAKTITPRGPSPRLSNRWTCVGRWLAGALLAHRVRRPVLGHARRHGLTGFIYAATLRLKKVPSAYIRQRAIKTANWAETCRVCTETQHQYTYSVAWIDGLQTGRKLGPRPRAAGGTRR